jgi:hypothetical protein
MAQPKKEKVKLCSVSIRLPETLLVWIKETTHRHGVSRDRLVAAALREFSKDRGLYDSFDKVTAHLNRIEKLCSRIEERLSTKLRRAR